MSDDLKRLRAFRGLLLEDGWPDWLDSTWTDADGPAVGVKADTPADVMAELRRLAEPHGVRIVVGGGSYFGWS